jgi:hypothetical protein
LVVLAAWYERPGPAADVLEVGEMSDPEPGRGEVRVRLTTSGITSATPEARRLGWLRDAFKGTSVVGINQGDAVPRESIPALVELHRQGRFPFDELIRVYAFDDIHRAAEDAAARTVVKPVLRMPQAD